MSTETLFPRKMQQVMVHAPSDVIVYQTSDYKRFSLINGNRALNLRKINRIIKDIESGNDMLKDYPINVKLQGNFLEILDGQHRFFIDQKLKRPVYYIIVAENKSMSEIARVNSNVEKWKITDFINCYINQGVSDYRRLQQFVDTYKFSVGMSLILLHSGKPGNEGSNKPLTDKFEQGTFSILFWDEAVAIAEMCKRFSTFPYWTDRGFIIAVYRINKAGLISMNDLVEAFLRNADKLTKQTSQKAYIYNLEQIVNTNKQKRIVII